MTAQPTKKSPLLHYSAIFLALTAVAFLGGFGVNLLAGGAVYLAKILFFVFLGLFVVCIVADIIKRKSQL